MTAATSHRPGSQEAHARERLRALATKRFEHSADATTGFIHGHAGLLARTCLEMAERFRRGGRLVAFGCNASATDAQHVAVEFMHPVIVGKRALPAIALAPDVSVLREPFVHAIGVLGRGNDIAMGLAADDGRQLVPALNSARQAGMLTIALVGSPMPPSVVDFELAVPSADPLIVQEIHELVYHVLWELVHVFLDHTEAT